MEQAKALMFGLFAIACLVAPFPLLFLALSGATTPWMAVSGMVAMVGVAFIALIGLD